MNRHAAAKRYQVLFVCMGNICRSPIAEGVTRSLAQRAGLAARIEFASAGTHGHYHKGEPPDPRARRVAARRGYDLSGIRARIVVEADFARYDRILAMDESNLSLLESICPEDERGKLGLFLAYAPELGLYEVPDPYYGAESGFERVLDLCERAANGLLAAVARGEL